MIGKTISHYRILERLGGGGMGVVWKAEDTRLGRPVALKLLPPRWSDDPQAKESFLREARATSVLDHPNICTIYEVGEAGDRLFIAMACYEGETLKTKLERGPLLLVEAVDYARQLAAGLAKSHENDLVHRDIKPGNVFITREGQVKILDFGLAKVIGEKGVSVTGLTQGTPAYMAPERLVEGATDARCDLWSIGVVLYESLSGKSPFLGQDIVETIQKIHTAEPEPLRSLCPALPAELSRLVAKLLKRHPDERIGSCRELIDALDAVVPSYTPMAREAVRPLLLEPRSVLRSFRLHRRSLIWAIAALSILVTALVLYLVRRARPGPAERPTLAVLFFDNLSGNPDLDWLRSGIADMLVSDLSQSEGLNVLSTDQIHEALAELEKGEGALSSSVLVRQVAERFSADHVVAGSIVSSGGRLRISVRLLETASGKVVTTRQVEGDGQEGLLSMVDDLSLGIRQRFEIPPATSDPDLEIGEITTASVAAWRFYTEGMHLHYQFKEEEAATLFAKAVELDPGFSMAWAKLAVAERNLDRPEAEAHAARALEGAGRILPRERAYVESFYYSYDVRDWERGIEASLKALELDANHHSVRHNLAIYYSVLELYDEAIRHGTELLRRGYAYPPTYQVLAEAYFLAGEEEKGLALLHDLAGRSPEAGFLARMALAWQYRRMGRYDEALESFDQADALHPGTAFGFTGRCMTYLLRGELDKAEELGRSQSLMNPAQRLSAVDCRILTALHRGRFEAALTETLGAIAEIGVDRFRARFRIRAARILLARGEEAAALEQAELARREGRGDFTEGEALFYAAWMKARLGDAAAAGKLAGELGDFAADVPGKSEKRRHRHLLGVLALAAGDTETAVAELEAAASLLPRRGVATAQRTPTHVALWSSLADAYRSAGRAADEIGVRERIVASTDERVYFPVLFVRSLARLGDLYEEAGEDERAREVRERFLAHWESGDLDRDEVAKVRKKLGAADREFR